MADNPYAAPHSKLDGLREPPLRSRWVALVLGLVAPPLAMLYLARPLRALAYLAILILALPGAALIGASGAVEPRAVAVFVSLALRLVAAVDGYRLARAWSGAMLPWYARAPALAAFFAVGWLSVLSLRAFVAEPFRIAAGSMQPTLRTGEHVLVSKTAYGWDIPLTDRRILRFAGPRQGDVAVFRYPPEPKLHYVMRVVGLPGDTIAYANKRLSINGKAQPLREAGSQGIDHAHGSEGTLVRYRETLDQVTHEIVLEPSAPPYERTGVQRFQGKDNCRYDEAGFECRVPVRHYFVMGDNRDNASDSRYWGFVPEENFVGRVTVIWYSPRNSDRAGTAVR